MSDVESVMREYVRRYEAGESADPSELLAEVEGLDRRGLEALIDAYLASAASAIRSRALREDAGERGGRVA